MWHKGLLHKCSITDFNIPVVGIHSLQVNTSKHCNKEKKLSSKPTGYTLSDTFFLSQFLFLPSGSTELKDTFQVYQTKGRVLQKQVLIAGCKTLLQKVESSSTFCNRICTSCAFYRTKETCFAASDVTLVYRVIPALFYPIRRRYSRNLSQLDLLQGRF